MTPYALILCLATVACSPAAAQMKTHGKASWYNDRLHGRLMANGKPYNRDSMTCAHLKFPLGTRLLVTNTRTKQQVLVHVTDRGPYSRRFVIDLSRRAAREAGILDDPNAPVDLVPVGSDYVVPFRPIDIDTIPLPLLDFDLDTPVDSLDIKV